MKESHGKPTAILHPKEFYVVFAAVVVIAHGFVHYYTIDLSYLLDFAALNVCVRIRIGEL